MSLGTLVFITPHQAVSPGLPTRPAKLLAEFVAADAFDDVVVVNRLRPAAIAMRIGRGRAIVRGGLPGLETKLADTTRLVEHPWPFGRLERRFAGSLVREIAEGARGGVVVWVADPKSVIGVLGEPGRRSWTVVLDAYDAWDRSPLVRGRRRRQAVIDGYQAAARSADLIFTNTPAMLERLTELGAASVQLLPNASPPVDAAGYPGDVERRGLVYVGRVHERFDTELALAVAAALPDTQITIAGPVEREPAGWSALARRPNVSLLGQIDPLEGRRVIATSAALLVPHRVDAYTRSQDAMKAWDAIATGTPVISTAIPPVDGWPAGLAEICADGDAFVAAARRAVAGALEPDRERRLQFARDNQWSARARTAIEVLENLGTGLGGRRR